MTTDPIRVAVVGAQGRMGSQACAAIEAAEDLDLVGRFGRGDDLGDLGGAAIAVDLTVPESSPQVVAHAVERGVHCVVGATGWSTDRVADLEGRLADHPGIGVLIAPNFAIGAVLMMRFAEQAARFYESVEIVEMHHPGKVDAPSGTATRTAELIATARTGAGMGEAPDATEHDPQGARGARVDGIPVHAVRLRGLTAHQEVIFGQEGETLTLRHDSFDRASFMPGLLAGVRQVAGHPGVTVGLEHYLGV